MFVCSRGAPSSVFPQPTPQTFATLDSIFPFLCFLVVVSIAQLTPQTFAALGEVLQRRLARVADAADSGEGAAVVSLRLPLSCGCCCVMPHVPPLLSRLPSCGVLLAVATPALPA